MLIEGCLHFLVKSPVFTPDTLIWDHNQYLDICCINCAWAPELVSSFSCASFALQLVDHKRRGIEWMNYPINGVFRRSSHVTCHLWHMQIRSLALVYNDVTIHDKHPTHTSKCKEKYTLMPAWKFKTTEIWNPMSLMFLCHIHRLKKDYWSGHLALWRYYLFCHLPKMQLLQNMSLSLGISLAFLLFVLCIIIIRGWNCLGK